MVRGDGVSWWLTLALGPAWVPGAFQDCAGPGQAEQLHPCHPQTGRDPAGTPLEPSGEAEPQARWANWTTTSFITIIATLSITIKDWRVVRRSEVRAADVDRLHGVPELGGLLLDWLADAGPPALLQYWLDNWGCFTGTLDPLLQHAHFFLRQLHRNGTDMIRIGSLSLHPLRSIPSTFAWH